MSQRSRNMHSKSSSDTTTTNKPHPSTMLTDCAASRTYPRERRPPDGHIYDASMPKETPSSPTDSSSKYLYSSGDSGFLSGAITSEQSLASTDDLPLVSSPKQQHSASSMVKQYTDSGFVEPELSSSVRIDSGVIDCGLNEQFSELNLKQTHLSDLNSPTCPIVPSSATATSYDSCVVPSDKEICLQQEYAYDPLLQYFEPDEDGDTQLHIAIVQGFIEVVYGLIRMAPHPLFLDLTNNHCQTPLHLAVLTSQAAIVRALTVAGVSAQTKDRNGNTALHVACSLGATDCVRAILKPVSVAETAAAGLSYFTAGTPKPSLEERNYDGQVCIHLAVAGGYVDVLRHLVCAGADVNAREAKCGRTALHVAAERGRRRVSQFLLNECPDIELNITTFTGYTAYQIAYYANPSLAKDLVAKGARKEIPETDSESDSEEEEEALRHLPVEGFSFACLNGASNKLIAA